MPIGFAKQHRLLAVRREGDVGRWWRWPIRSTWARSTICARSSGAEVQPVLVPSQRILEVINEVYGRKQDKGGDLGEKGEEEDERAASEELVDILEITDEAPIIRWVNSLHVQRGQGARQRYPHRAGREGGAWSATASTACSTSRARRRGSSCPRSSRA